MAAIFKIVGNMLRVSKLNVPYTKFKKHMKPYWRYNKDALMRHMFLKTIHPFLSKDSFHGGEECIILQYDGIFIHNEQEVCNIFNKYFCKHNEKLFSNDRDVTIYVYSALRLNGNIQTKLLNLKK